ncbi:hypothetical protein GCM10010250_05490 [Streptomyces althioticus]|nr:hypothetical protein GCM10010250_05490 [Streptomyces althioticus]
MSAGEPRSQGPDRRFVERSVGPDHVRECGAGQELGGDPGTAVLRPGVQDTGHRRGRDRPGHLRLADEAAGKAGVVGQVRVQHLHGGDAALAVPADVDLAHASLAQYAVDAVRTQTDRVSGFEGLHGGCGFL